MVVNGSRDELHADRHAEFEELHTTLQSNEMGGRSRRVYTIVGLVLVLYMVVCVALMSRYEPNMQWFSYYVVDYKLGFVRRGLAGEIVDLFPADLYFTILMTLRWLVPALFMFGLAAVAWTVAVRFGRSERRLMLALLIPVLPFGFVRAVVLPMPNLLGEAALAAFAVVIASVKKDRSILFASAAYGLTTAVLTLVHEAIPLLISLGALMAIAVLAAHSSIKIQRLSALLAVAPGLVVALAIGLLGQRDESAQCARLPHRAVYWPVKLTMSQILSGQRVYADYNDWVCHHIISLFGLHAADANAVKFFAELGAPLIMTTMFGIVVLAVTILVISRISGVPFRRFCGVLRGRLLWVIFGALLLLPVFATAIDWVRWWVAISFDVGVVYLLYASDQPESAQPPTRRARVLFAVAIVLFALLPSGTVAHVGVLQHVRTSVE
jgi:hypothetical protein